MHVVVGRICNDPRQRSPVDLAGECSRHRVDARHACRHHVLRQFATQTIGDLLPFERVLRGTQHDVCHEMAIGLVALHVADDLAHVVAARDRGFDRLEFDAVTAHLDLRVDATEVAQPTVLLLHDQIAGAVDAPDSRQGRETRGGQLVETEVAARQPRPGDAQLAGLADGHRLQILAENVRHVGRNRRADRHRLAGPHPSTHDRDGALGRSIAVLQPQRAAPRRRQVRRQWLAADVAEAQVRQFFTRRVAVHGPQQRRRRTQHGDALGAQPRDEIGAEAHGLVVHHHDGGTAGESQPLLLDRRVVGRRTALRHALVGRDRKPAEAVPDQIDDTAMLDEHTLRAPGRARRVDRVRETALVRPRGAWRGLARFVDERVVHDEDRHVEADAGEALGADVVGDDRNGICIVHDVMQVVVRE